MANDDQKDSEGGTGPGLGGRKLDRRDMLLGLSTVPALGLFGYAWNRQRGYEQAQKKAASVDEATPDTDVPEVNVALLGSGAQGQVLLDSMLRIPGLRFRAVCDIWEEYNQKRAVRILKKFGFEVNGYLDYREMLDKEKDLDAVVIATPDFWHAPHTVGCLEAGKHVYCEKEMSNTLEGARSMVLAARKSGKLLQIGHQRRSHPRYLHAHDKLLQEAELLGRIVTVNGQWNRAVSPDLGWPERYAIPEARLKEFGFKSMAQFRNWRWYKGLGGGPIVDLGSHQIDIFNWFLGANPSHVIASGGLDYHDPATHEWYDTVMTVYEFQTRAPWSSPSRKPPTRGTCTATPTPPPGTSGSSGATSRRPSSRRRCARTRRRCSTSASRCRPTSTPSRSCSATRITSRTCRTSSTPSAAPRPCTARRRSATRRRSRC
jgi:predicted dehydrogenase